MDEMEHVYVELGRWDGPESGVADLDGEPHYFQRMWDQEEDDYSADGRHALWPIDMAILRKEIEAWHIFVAWNIRYQNGEATTDSHPGRGDLNPRYKQLNDELKAERQIPESFVVRQATLQPLDRAKRYTKSGPDYAITWTQPDT